MVKVDLITGFLGAGKTTFIRKYVSYLLQQGEKICILENDHGAINVDMMLLSDLRSDRLGIEMVAGGCDYDCHRRRFRTKLILDRRYEIANVLTIVSADLEENLSEEADYLLASQAAQAGRLIYSRVQEADARAIEAVTAHVNRALAAIKCSRTFSPGENITVRDWDRMTEADWQEIMTAGYAETGFEKRFSMDETGFQALFFMRISIPKDQVLANIRRIWQDPDVGRIFRIKGFLGHRRLLSGPVLHDPCPLRFLIVILTMFAIMIASMNRF